MVLVFHFVVSASQWNHFFDIVHNATLSIQDLVSTIDGCSTNIAEKCKTDVTPEILARLEKCVNATKEYRYSCQLLAQIQYQNLN